MLADSAISDLARRSKGAADAHQYTESVRLCDLASKLSNELKLTARADVCCQGSPGQGSPGKHGLVNMINTCFLNNVLFTISHISPLQHHMQQDHAIHAAFPPTWRRMTGPQKLCTAIKDWVDFDWSGSTTPCYKPEHVLQALRIISSEYQGQRQHDANLCRRDILQALHTAIGDENGNSFVKRMFGMSQVSVLACTTCGHRSDKSEELSEVPVRVHGAVTPGGLLGLLDRYFSCDKLVGDDKWACPVCVASGRGKQVASKNLLLKDAPECLIIELQRLHQHVSPTGGAQNAKDSRHVAFPAQLDVAPYLAEDSSAPQPRKYELQVVSCHHGNEDSGHWKAYCRDDQAGTWHCYNDSRVTEVGLGQLAQVEASCLFYQRLRCGQGQRFAPSVASDLAAGNQLLKAQALTLVRPPEPPPGLTLTTLSTFTWQVGTILFLFSFSWHVKGP